MTKKNYLDIALLMGITLLLFFPLFYTHYFYTDEINQLWFYRKDDSFHMFIPQGRYLTDRLLAALFRSISTISQINRLHIFSLLGWMACIPVWYLILEKVTRREQLPPILPFFAVLYLVACPPFTIYVSWASTMELFIANTAGLIAGYLLYTQIKWVDGRMQLSTGAILSTILFGLIALFTYQNGFGCFLLPFLLQLISKKKLTRPLVIALVFYFFIFLVYFMLFHWQMKELHMDTSSRTGLATNPVRKILFFFGFPLAGAFRFTWIVNEWSRDPKIISLLVFAGYIALNAFRVRYLSIVLCLLILCYLPSLVVSENYASNRTMLALDMAVFLLVFTTLLQWIGKERRQRLIACCVGVLLVINAWYNFHYQFLGPVTNEYGRVRNYLDTRYRPDITSVAFIRPSEELFRHKYRINISWDEFGVPSNSREWVPEFFVRQVVLEKTGSRAAADSLVIKNWKDRAAWEQSDTTASPHTLVVDVEKILQ
jgi:hypothetical protein